MELLLDNAWSYAVLLCWGVFLLLIFWLIANLAKATIIKFGSKLSNSKQVVINLLAKTSKVIILLFGLVTSLGSMGIDVTALVAGLGLTGFAVGFALKDTLSNILAGVLVIVYQPFRINQYIKISTYMGKVSLIDLRYTTLIADNRKILIPNTLILTREIIVSDDIIEI